MKEEIKKEQARNFFKKALDDKRAISECIRGGGDLKKLMNERGIKFANPV